MSVKQISVKCHKCGNETFNIEYKIGLDEDGLIMFPEFAVCTKCGEKHDTIQLKTMM